MTGYPGTPQPLSPATFYAPPPRRSKWPTAIGIISIIYGGLFASCAGLGALGGGVGKFNAGEADIAQNLPSWYMSTKTTIDVMHLLVLLLLIVAGIMLLRRHPLSRVLYLLYTGLDLLLMGASMIMAPVVFSALPETMPNVQSVRSIAIATTACVFAFLLAYPVFLLIWFLRAKIRDEVYTWRSLRNQVRQ